MRIGVIVMNFGEPESPSRDQVVPFLERIFLSNASLEPDAAPEQVRARSRQLAERRAPGLMEEYEEIGGSPLNAQAREQARLLEAELLGRGVDATCYDGFQYTRPFIEEAVERARADGIERIVGLPIYPMCGRSTTVAALASMTDAVKASGWDVEARGVAGWHRHPDYVPLHADNVRAFAARHGIDLDDPRTRVVFSAHGTPVKYLVEGNRYDQYVEDLCRALGGALGVAHYALGFQNHGNRPIEWTKPDIDVVIRGLDADRAVVVAVSFMHEQSETLAELDRELRRDAESAGLEFFRVPIPHAHPRFIAVLADLVEGAAGVREDAAPLEPCLCRSEPGTCCLNGESFA